MDFGKIASVVLIFMGKLSDVTQNTSTVCSQETTGHLYLALLVKLKRSDLNPRDKIPIGSEKTKHTFSRELVCKRAFFLYSPKTKLYYTIQKFPITMTTCCRLDYLYALDDCLWPFEKSHLLTVGLVCLCLKISKVDYNTAASSHDKNLSRSGMEFLHIVFKRHPL